MQANSRTIDGQWMKMAVKLARKGSGKTAPNPPVGAVIVKNGKCISSGWHRKAGTGHAEVIAIKNAGALAKGATLYVTLEPCSTTGRTGPCTSAIASAGIKRIVVGSIDPNPLHEGRGIHLLETAGLKVAVGVLSGETDSLISPFTKLQKQGRPFLTLKMAMSLDGRITDRNGRSKWISSDVSRKSVRRFRGKVDAVMVGVGTVVADDPELRPILAGSFQPFRIVVDTKGRTPLNSTLLSDRLVSKTIIVVGQSCPKAIREAITSTGARVIQAKEKSGKINLKDMMRRLGNLGIMHILCEGGATLAASLIKEEIPDEYQIYSAPILLGDTGTLPVLQGQGWTLNNAPLLDILKVKRSGPDILYHCKPKGKS